MATITQTFLSTPAQSEDHGLGGQRIRETRDETQKRFAVEHDVGDSSVTNNGAGYTDTGRHSPGSAVAFTGATAPTTLKKPDGSSLINVPNGSVNLGDLDEGRIWYDEGGGAPVLRTWDILTLGSSYRWQAAYGCRNHFTNGSLLVWQRGTTATVTTSSSPSWLVDRFYTRATGANLTASRQPTSFSSPRSTYVLRLAASVAGNTGAIVGYRFLSSDVPALQRGGGRVTFSFRIANNTSSSVTPTYSINEPNATDTYTTTTNRVAATNLTAVPSSSSAYQSVTIDLNAIGSIANGFEIVFNMGAVGNGTNIEVGEFQCEWGTDRSPFVERPFNEELSACLPYYEKTFNYSVAPATNAGIAGALVFSTGGNSAANRAVAGTWTFKAPKVRSNYAVSFFNPLATNTLFRNLTDGADTPSGASVTINGNDTRGTYQTSITNSVALAGSDSDDAVAIHATCESELT